MARGFLVIVCLLLLTIGLFSLYMIDDGEPPSDPVLPFDPGFGVNGVVVIQDPSAPDTEEEATAMALDSGGDIIVAGTLRPDNIRGVMAVWRLDSSGDLDRNFGIDGWFTHSQAAGMAMDAASDVVIDSAGRILVAGTGASHLRGDAFRHDLVVWRLLPSGVLDPKWGQKGWITHDDAGASGSGGEYDDMGRALTLDEKGRVLVAGYAGKPRTDEFRQADMVVWRFLDDGKLDPAFGGRGWITHDNAAGGAGADEGHAITLDGSQRIVVAGSSVNRSWVADMAVWRLLDDGKLDGSFNGRGWVVHGSVVEEPLGHHASDVAVDSEERIVVCGTLTRSGLETDLVIWRLDEEGSLDPTFGGSGWVSHDEASGHALAMDPRGRIVIAGSSADDLAVWRFNRDGTLDSAFPGHGGGTDLALDSQGGIVIAGSGRDAILWRLRP